jgi:hypothetical protein
MKIKQIEKTSIKQSSWITKLGGLLTIVLASSTFYSCSTPAKPLATSNLNPAGKGTVRVSEDANKNTDLAIEVKHLAPPERISADAKTYVVWLTPIDQSTGPQNVGALSVDRSLNGKLQTSTPLRSFDLFVTAEPSATTSEPSGEKMFWTQVNNRKTG